MATTLNAVTFMGQSYSTMQNVVQNEEKITLKQRARGMGSPRHVCNRRRRTREGPEPACVQTPFSMGVAHAGEEG